MSATIFVSWELKSWCASFTCQSVLCTADFQQLCLPISSELLLAVPSVFPVTRCSLSQACAQLNLTVPVVLSLGELQFTQRLSVSSLLLYLHVSLSVLPRSLLSLPRRLIFHSLHFPQHMELFVREHALYVAVTSLQVRFPGWAVNSSVPGNVSPSTF